MGHPEPTEESYRALSEQNELYSKTDSLLANPAFQWFLAECIGSECADAESVALDTKRSKDDRDIAAHVREVLNRVKKWTEEKRTSAREYIQSVQP